MYDSGEGRGGARGQTSSPCCHSRRRLRLLCPTPLPISPEITKSVKVDGSEKSKLTFFHFFGGQLVEFRIQGRRGVRDLQPLLLLPGPAPPPLPHPPPLISPEITKSIKVDGSEKSQLAYFSSLHSFGGQLRMGTGFRIQGRGGGEGRPAAPGAASGAGAASPAPPPSPVSCGEGDDSIIRRLYYHYQGAVQGKWRPR